MNRFRSAVLMGCPIVALLAILFAGCSITQPTVKVDYYQLDYPSPASTQPRQLDVVLGIRRFGIAAAYDHDRLEERDKGFRTTQSYYHRWVNNPRMMLSDLLLRDVQASGNYKAVVMLPANVLPDYEINGFVQDIVKDNTGPAPQVVISMDVTLLRNQDRPSQSRVVFQKTYASQIPCPDNSPSGIAKAMSQAFADISSRIQQDVCEMLQKAMMENNPPVPAAEPPVSPVPQPVKP